MRRVLSLVLVTLVVLGVNSVLLAGGGTSTGDIARIGPCTCGDLSIDEDGDGVCDDCGGCIPTPDGDGPYGPKGPQGPKGPKELAANGTGDIARIGPCTCEFPIDIDPEDGYCDDCGGCIPTPDGDGPYGPKGPKGPKGPR